MPKKLGVFVIHGMGDQQPNFADDMIAELKERIRDEGGYPDEVAFEPAFWADVLSGHQHEMWNKMNDANDLDWSSLRKFVLNSFGDATAYQRAPDEPDDIYAQVHRRILSHLQALRAQLGDADAPLLVLAHSLGCDMMSNYIYDQQNPANKPVLGTTPFEQMKTLCGLITFGCNIVLFSLAHERYVGIQFPPAGLPAQLAALAEWRNYYDPDDILGWPVKELCPEYEANGKVTDFPINVGGLLTSWNPAAHSEYWTDNDLTKPTAKKIVSLLRVI